MAVDMKALRRLHNQAKMDALTSAVREAETSGGFARLLDIGCGPASDVHKYARLGMTNVIGFDNDAEVIAEAHRRTERYRGMHYQFEVCQDVLARLASMTPGSVDVATCHFSAHFFAHRLAQLCSAVRRVVRPGGVWVVATIDGDRVPDEAHNKYITIRKRDGGRWMEYALAGTRYFSMPHGTPDTEPVLATSALVRNAHDQGLQLVGRKDMGARGVPRHYPTELAAITAFHECLLFK